MTAPVFQGSDCTLSIAVEHNRLVHDRTSQRSVVQLLGPGSNIPPIADIGLNGVPRHLLGLLHYQQRDIMQDPQNRYVCKVSVRYGNV